MRLIESMHWQLDVGLKEDVFRIRVDDRAEVFARIRQMVLNLLKQEKSFKAGIQRTRMMCAYGPRVPRDRAEKPFMTGMFMRFPWRPLSFEVFL
ncbi:hypothetical protein BZG13_14995 [Salinivibrio sp. ML323]|nr:hypothetical protein BZG13_14995 [Salinivibrio sp. ML323]